MWLRGVSGSRLRLSDRCRRGTYRLGRAAVEVKLAHGAHGRDSDVPFDADGRMALQPAVPRRHRQPALGQRFVGLMHPVPRLARRLQDADVVLLQRVVLEHRLEPPPCRCPQMSRRLRPVLLIGNTQDRPGTRLGTCRRRRGPSRPWSALRNGAVAEPGRAACLLVTARVEMGEAPDLPHPHGSLHRPVLRWWWSRPSCGRLHSAVSSRGR